MFSLRSTKRQNKNLYTTNPKPQVDPNRKGGKHLSVVQFALMQENPCLPVTPLTSNLLWYEQFNMVFFLRQKNSASSLTEFGNVCTSWKVNVYLTANYHLLF